MAGWRSEERRAAQRRRAEAQRWLGSSGESWPLRHLSKVLLAGVIIAALVGGGAYWLTGGADFQPRFETALRGMAAVAAAVAGLLTWARLELSRGEHRLGTDRDLTERFSRSIDQLGHSDPLVQVGGIFALERFALDAARVEGTRDVDWRMALDVLDALVRKLSADALEATDQELLSIAAPIGVVEAVRVLGRFKERSGRAAPARHLRGVVLNGADLDFAFLEFADLTDAHLVGADLMEVYLQEATLVRVDLSNAELTEGSLDQANLSNANLYGAKFLHVSLVGAKLHEATLTGADLSHSNLSEADLSGADLRAVTGYHVQTDSPWLGPTLMRSVDLSGADLRGADLSNVDLTGAKLDDVLTDEETVWPDESPLSPTAT